MTVTVVSGLTVRKAGSDKRRRRENRGAEREGNGEGVSPPQLTRGLGKHRELPSGVWGRAPAENEFGAFCGRYRRTLIATICLISVSLNTAVA